MKTDADILRILRRLLLTAIGEIEGHLGYRPTTAQLWEQQKRKAPTQ